MQTAVEFLLKWINDNLSESLIPIHIKEQAKEMEKQQIIDAYRVGECEVGLMIVNKPEQYYNETFKPELTSQLPGINVNDVKPSNPQMVKDIF